MRFGEKGRLMSKVKLLWLVVLTACSLPVRAEEIVDAEAYPVHDPSMIKSGEYFYVYSTGILSDTFEMRRSRNLHNWEYLGSVLPEIPQWVQNKISGVSNLWAPDPFYHNGKYYLNYSGSRFGTNISTIGLLSNVTLDPFEPNYEWIDEGEIISSANQGVNYNTIDGAFVKDQSGQMWLAFGSFWSGIKMTPLDSTTLKPTTSPATLYSIASRSSTAIEASYIRYRNGYYYLFVNFDTCCQGVDSTYNIRVGRSTSITGPYLDKNGISMMVGGGTLLLGSEGRWIGPGHASIVNVDGQDFFSYHAYDALENGSPALRVHYLEWDGNGWPVISDPVVPEAGGTIGFWTFEDGSPGALMNDTGLTAQTGSVDLSGNDFHMYAWDDVYGPSFSLEGQTPTGVGLSCRCDGGQDGYTADAFINNWSPAAWTIELAVKLDNLTGWQTMIGRDGSSQGESESDFYFQKQDTSDTFRINFDTAGGQRYILDADFTVAAGQWYYLAAVSDGTTLTMYADKLDGNGYGVVGTLALNGANDNALAAPDEVWTFGRGWFNGGLVDHITGNLDDIRFTDRALEPTEFLHSSALVIVETGGVTEISEEGPTQDTYTIRLHQTAGDPPLTDTVTLTLSTDGQVTVNPNELVWTPAAWDTEYTVTVTAVDDSTLEADPHGGHISHALSSGDGRYDSPVFVPDVIASITENECGAWGYLGGDLNFDCTVDLPDFELLASVWPPSMADLVNLAADWLQTTQPFVPGAVHGTE